MRYLSLLGLSFCLTVSSLVAGDVAVFRNLGFSPDSRYFQFAQYGIDSTTQNPYAETAIVDVPKNDFVPNGLAKNVFPVGVTLGDDGQKALLAHLEKIAHQRKQYKLDYLQQGRPIYFRVTGENSVKDYDHFQVLDYKTGKEYSLDVKKTVSNVGAAVASSFFIQLDVKDKTGKLLGTYKVGNPQIQRKGVQNYTVVQMILTPNDRALVFVVEKEELDGQGGVNIRAMIETITL